MFLVSRQPSLLVALIITSYLGSVRRKWEQMHRDQHSCSNISLQYVQRLWQETNDAAKHLQMLFLFLIWNGFLIGYQNMHSILLTESFTEIMFQQKETLTIANDIFGNIVNQLSWKDYFYLCGKMFSRFYQSVLFSLIIGVTFVEMKKISSYANQKLIKKLVESSDPVEGANPRTLLERQRISELIQHVRVRNFIYTFVPQLNGGWFGAYPTSYNKIVVFISGLAVVWLQNPVTDQIMKAVSDTFKSAAQSMMV